MKHPFAKMAVAAVLYMILLPAQAAVVPGQLLGVFSGNDSVSGLFDNLGLTATFLARVETPSSVEMSSLSNDGLTISNFTLNNENEAIVGQWSYDGPAIANVIALKINGHYAVYLFNDEITDGMPNIGLWDTSEVLDKGLSHITAYSVAVVPLPGALVMLGSALAGLGLARRRSS